MGNQNIRGLLNSFNGAANVAPVGSGKQRTNLGSSSYSPYERILEAVTGSSDSSLDDDVCNIDKYTNVYDRK